MTSKAEAILENQKMPIWYNFNFTDIILPATVPEIDKLAEVRLSRFLDMMRVI